MEPKDHLDEQEKILAQYKMGHGESKSVKAWSKEYAIEDILDGYLEKSGYPTSKPREHAHSAEHHLHKEHEILQHYKMTHEESQSVKAWDKEYGIADILNDYLEKSGYSTGA